MAARCVVISRDGEVQKAFVLGIGLGQDRGPPRVDPQGILVVLCPVHQIVTARQPDAPALVQAIPAPVAITTTLHLQHRHSVREFIAFPGLCSGQNVPRRR